MNSPEKNSEIIIGHQKTIEQLSRLAEQNSLANTLLFCGSSGIGKKLVARHLATIILEADIHNHPDFFEVDCSISDNISAQAIRTLLNKSSRKPFCNKGKVLIFDHAEMIPVVSANIMLKTLEEPRPDTFYILISDNPSKLPITILSRCQNWNFPDLTSEEIRKIIQLNPEFNMHLDFFKNNQVFDLNNLSLDLLQRIATYAEIWTMAQEIFDSCLKEDTTTTLTLVDKLMSGKDSQDNKQNLATAVFFLHTLTNHHLKLSLTENPTLTEKLLNLANNLNHSDYYLFQRHLNPKVFFLNMFSNPDFNAEQLAIYA